MQRETNHQVLNFLMLAQAVLDADKESSSELKKKIGDLVDDCKKIENQFLADEKKAAKK